MSLASADVAYGAHSKVAFTPNRLFRSPTIRSNMRLPSSGLTLALDTRTLVDQCCQLSTYFCLGAALGVYLLTVHKQLAL